MKSKKDKILIKLIVSLLLISGISLFLSITYFIVLNNKTLLAKFIHYEKNGKPSELTIELNHAIAAYNSMLENDYPSYSKIDSKPYRKFFTKYDLNSFDMTKFLDKKYGKEKYYIRKFTMESNHFYLIYSTRYDTDTVNIDFSPTLIETDSNKKLLALYEFGNVKNTEFMRGGWPNTYYVSLDAYQVSCNDEDIMLLDLPGSIAGLKKLPGKESFSFYSGTPVKFDTPIDLKREDDNYSIVYNHVDGTMYAFRTFGVDLGIVDHYSYPELYSCPAISIQTRHGDWWETWFIQPTGTYELTDKINNGVPLVGRPTER